jgi:hypothetical protein
MDELLKALAGNSIATIILLVTVVLVEIIFVVAFFQGHEIALWPPRISPRSSESREMVQMRAINIPADSSKKNVFYDGSYQGIRTILVPVEFDRPFKKHVKVMVSLQKIDLGDPVKPSINRLQVRAENARLSG